jgi:hypothetical protein
MEAGAFEMTVYFDESCPLCQAPGKPGASQPRD